MFELDRGGVAAFHWGRSAMFAAGSGLLALSLCTAWAIRHRGTDAVRSWHTPTGRRLRAGPLFARLLGSGDPVIVLLHGLAGSGEYFGAAFDELGRTGTLVIPDLLGFGASMRPPGGDPADYSAAAHLEALDAMLAALGLANRPLVIVGHSMGASLGLRWAARQTTTQAVVAFAVPLFANARQGRARLRELGTMAALATSDGPVARGMCAWMCRYRRTASWIATALHPELPVPIARAAVQHTWASYHGSLTELVLHNGWRDAVVHLAAAGTPLLLANGAADLMAEPGHAAALVAEFGPSVTVTTHPTGGHDLPLTQPYWCLAQVQQALRHVPAPPIGG
ncbi:alpha/beta fold hydrolase [Amycolatopsis marina]|nr:alpha/beta hydrolase [Amycolatopsis marina]